MIHTYKKALFIAAALFLLTFGSVQTKYHIDYNFDLSIDPAERRLLYEHRFQKTGKRKDCLASWYGGYFHGRTTANMEIYNKYALTVAHKKLPFNTYLLITNKKNGKKVIARVNDRGPYIEGREVDLSEGVALALGGRDDGLLNIQYEILKKDLRNPTV